MKSAYLQNVLTKCFSTFQNLRLGSIKFLEWWLQTDRIRRMCVCVSAIGWWCDDAVKSSSVDYKRIACVVCECVCYHVMMRWCCKILEWWLQTDRMRRMCVCVSAIGWWSTWDTTFPRNTHAGFGKPTNEDNILPSVPETSLSPCPIRCGYLSEVLFPMVRVKWHRPRPR